MYQSLILEVHNHIAHLKINRPDKSNSFDQIFWGEFGKAIKQLDYQKDVRVIVLSAEGKNFSAGMDLELLMNVKQEVEGEECPGRAREKLRKDIRGWQEAITSIEMCQKPVIAAIHGACVGAGVDLVSACDMRYCTADVVFCVKEVDLGIVADLGTLQRLIKIIPYGKAMELAITARNVNGPEAEQLALVNKHFETKEEMIKEILQLSSMIAHKSPLAVRGTKQVLLHARDHSVQDGLDYVAAWNASTLISKDVEVAMMAKLEKELPIFRD